ncbi:hypothetical protein TW83_10020 [Paracoccus sp. S4493]|uniref:DUF2793 domain-containing protein n=1 Tax=Paracoccus sp. S4493 TaxID=579490 RepID=UPI0005F9B093|nr:DUF2793 domain-containing protein [Paracoccus sp. S4493]KJZ31249.1 hypothetical protein TW83_10020 [Paracoccus sp. S4493]
MSSKQMIGLGLAAEWPLGEDGWNTGMDENLLRLSALVGLSVPSVTSPLVEAATVQIAPVGHANAGRIGAFKDGAWWWFQPLQGMRAHVRDVGRSYVYSGTSWVPASELHSYSVNAAVVGNYVISEADFLVGASIIVTSDTDVTVTIPASSGQVSAGSDLDRRPVTIVQRGEGRVTITGEAGVVVESADDHFTTRKRSSGCSIMPVSTSEYILLGDLAE